MRSGILEEVIKLCLVSKNKNKQMRLWKPKKTFLHVKRNVVKGV